MRNTRAARCLTIAALSLLALPASAQTPGDRASLLAWNDSLASMTRDFASQLQRPEGQDRDLIRLRNAFTLLRQGVVDSSARTLRKAGDEFFTVTARHDDWVMPWYGIGLTERALAAGKFPVLPTRFHPIGADHNQGAMQAYMYVLQRDSTFLPGVEGLADATASSTRWGYTGKARDALRKTDASSPASLLLRARLERADNRRERALGLLRQSLQMGGDSGLTYLELAREQFVLLHDSAATASYWAGVAHATSPEAVKLLQDNLRLVAGHDELTGFDSLTPAARTALVQRFWNIRDVEAGVGAGDRLREHYSRYEIATLAFRPVHAAMSVVPLTPAARMASSFGFTRPTFASYSRLDSPTSAYGYQQLASIDYSLPKSSYGLDDGYGTGTVGRSYTSDRPFGAGYRRWTDLDVGGLITLNDISKAGEFDARGEAYVRYGKPDNTAGNLWVYHRPGGDLVVPVNGWVLGDLCSVLVRYCTYELAGRMPPNAEQRLRTELLAARDTLLSSDRMVRTFREELTPAVDAYALVDGGTGGGRILVAMAIPARQITPDSVADGFVYPVRIQLIAAPLSGSYRVERDTTRYFHTDRRLGQREYLQAVELLPVTADEYRLRVVVQTLDGTRGAVKGDDSVQVSSIHNGVALGDLVLGRDGSGLTWWSGGDRLKLNPSGRMSKTEPLYLYYQLGGLPLGRPYRTSLEVFHATAPGEKALISLSYDELADQPLMEVQRVLDLNQLDSGVHTIRLTIQDNDGKILARRFASVRVE